MVYVPGGLTFPTGTDDKGNATVADPYWIGETEVTYELWNKVYTWATANGYFFANTGVKGSCGSGDVTQPATTINWRDAMVFSNALTEWYNAIKGTSYSCVYKVGDTPIRDSRDSNATQCDAVDQNTSAKGFRLLTSNEWELAARYIGTTAPTMVPLDSEAIKTIINDATYYWTPGNHASGAGTNYMAIRRIMSKMTRKSPATKDDKSVPPPTFNPTTEVAWYGKTGTQNVKKLRANQLGLYDMSGNVEEWCFDLTTFASFRVFRRGSWDNDAIGMQIGDRYYGDPFYANNRVGFRLARTAD